MAEYRTPQSAGKYMLRSIVLTVAVLMSGCAAVGPTDPNMLRVKAEAILPAGDNAVSFVSPATWSPNTRGFTSLRSFVVPPPPNQGVFVLTKQSIFFHQWDGSNERYHAVKRIPIDQVREASIDTFGRQEALVIQSGDFEANTFSFTGLYAQAVEPGQANAVYKLMPVDSRR